MVENSEPSVITVGSVADGLLVGWATVHGAGMSTASVQRDIALAYRQRRISGAELAAIRRVQRSARP